jgi:cell division protein FtsW
MAFMNPWADPDGIGYQLIQSKIAIGSGGVWGLGPGASVQKAGFLPGTDNDFVFSILAEELGFIGATAIIVLFVLLVLEGLRVVRRAPDPFAFALGLGLTLLLGLQAVLHIAVVTGSVPTKGLSLPFISAGGSSLLTSMLAAGILVNIARTEERHTPAPVGVPDDAPEYERKVEQAVERLGSACIEKLGSLLPDTGSEAEEGS